MFLKLKDFILLFSSNVGFYAYRKEGSQSDSTGDEDLAFQDLAWPGVGLRHPC